MTKLTGQIHKTKTLTGNITIATGGAKTYGELPDKPSINSVVLEGNKTADDLKLQKTIELASEHDIDDMFWGID